jgi:hypothetical protein
MPVRGPLGPRFQFTSTQLTLNIGELVERVIRPAMMRLAEDMVAANPAFARTYDSPSLRGTAAKATPIRRLPGLQPEAPEIDGCVRVAGAERR